MPKPRRYIVTVEFYVRASSEARAQQIVERELDVWGFEHQTVRWRGRLSPMSSSNLTSEARRLDHATP